MKLYPNWKGNIVVFSSLIVLLLGNFFWQVQKTNRTFREHSLEHSKVLGAVVELNIRNSLMSRAGMETIVGSYLKNSAQFIGYLDKVESFSKQELAAFANKSGLAGIKIFRNSKTDQITGPKGWLPGIFCQGNNEFKFLSEEHLYVYTLPYSTEILLSQQDCIIVGMSSKETEKIQKTMSVETLLDVLNQMEGIEYVRFQSVKNKSGTFSSLGTTLIHINGKPISETRIAMGDKELVIGFEANYFFKRMEQLRKELIVFVSFLIFFGCFSSWWLYRIQRHRLEQTRGFERKMARQLEQASLGRAASTITHEMRNPLNAISMGLQRLEIESKVLDDEHRYLVTSMRQAVERSNSVITNLQQYVRSFELIYKDIIVAKLIEPLLVLYHPQCKKSGIKLELQLDETIIVIGDGNYLTQAFENLIKNAVEAQPDGGFVKITLLKKKKECLIHFENQCLTLKPGESKMIIEPYFTTKTYGTGLGLAICKKIIEAHSGQLKIDVKNEIFSAYVSLLLNHEPAKRQV
jgi:two-component system, NtrC family, sensor histidine kinase HydH